MYLCRPTHPQRVVRHIRLGLAIRAACRSGPPVPDGRTPVTSRQQGVVPDTTSIRGFDEHLERRTVPFAQGVTWRCPTTWEQ
jgi:hypothetical protein